MKPPVYLHVGLRESADINKPTPVELVLAQHGEEALALSNRWLFARLGMPSSMITFARAYKFPEWLDAVCTRFAGQWVPEALPELLPSDIGRPDPADDEPLTGDGIAEI